MEVEIRLFGGLEQFRPGARFGEPFCLALPPGACVRTLLEELGIPEEKAFSILVNGRQAAPEDALSPGDRVSIFPPIGGG